MAASGLDWSDLYKVFEIIRHVVGDEDTIKAQQMVEQVSTMVKENPDAAASLVKRWLNRS